MKTIILIGMMGSGKTTIGKILGEKLNIESFDIDSIIEAQTNKSVSEIFSSYGEIYFRELEKNTIKEIFKPDNKIISLGGGAFENNETRNLLLNNSTIIYLKTSPITIYERIKNDTKRPLLKNKMSIKKITELINLRQKNYELANLHISTDNKRPNTIINEILGAL